jgi:hypothetical protein
MLYEHPILGKCAQKVARQPPIDGKITTGGSLLGEKNSPCCPFARGSRLSRAFMASAQHFEDWFT